MPEKTEQTGEPEEKKAPASKTDSESGKNISTKKKVRQQFIHTKFIAAYAGTFSKNFDKLLAEGQVNSQSGTGPPINGSDLYSLIFAPDLSTGAKEKIRTTFRNIIRYTSEADAILSRTWLIMIRDLAGYLADNKGIISDLHPLTSHINELTGILFDIFFRMSKVVEIKLPDINMEAPSNQKILETFKKYAHVEDTGETDYKLKIHTYYRGIPVELDANVLNVDTNSVTFSIHPYEAVALSKLGIAFIHSSFHGTSFEAYTSSVDVEQRTATFTHFIPQSHTNERRAYIRVEPNGFIKVKIIHETSEISGILYDMSEVAAAIYVRNINIEVYKPDMPVQFIANLPDVFEKGSTLINTPCEVLKVYKQTKGDPNAHRLVLRMGDDQQLKSKLIRHISQRQTEILQELKGLSEEE